MGEWTLEPEVAGWYEADIGVDHRIWLQVIDREGDLWALVPIWICDEYGDVRRALKPVGMGEEAIRKWAWYHLEVPEGVPEGVEEEQA